MRTLAIIVVNMLTLSVQAQIEKNLWHWQSIDSMQVICQYEFTHLNFLFPNERRELKEDCILQIGRRLSKFYSLKSWKLDSLTSQQNGAQEIQRRKIKALSAPSKGRAQYDQMWQSTFPSYGQRHIVYKNYPEDVITIQDAMGQNYFMYEDTLNNQAWQLEEETQNIIGFHCQKAVCEWRGRSYTAWFTEEIPMSDGPYKFCGLPGLIVQVYDKNREYEWTLLGVQRVQNKEIYLSAPVNYDADKSYEPYDRRELLRKMNKSYMGIAKKLNADDIMLGKEPHISSIRDLIELDYK